MSKQARKELLESLRIEYERATWQEKGLLLDGFVTATGHNRKYAIGLLGSEPKTAELGRQRRRKYDRDVQQALKAVWLASNRIAAKRLVPFIPKLLEKMEKFGYIRLSEQTKEKLLKLSAATVDRLLKEEKRKYSRGKSTTKPGRLLKKHIPVRTFADWNDAEIGFLEADCVAHCGETTKGQFLNTLTLTDIATGWTDFEALLRKSEFGVLAALAAAVRRLPFPLKGLDTDNGSEFINAGLLKWCTDQGVTFTRSREYKKNDQAHVEEKNGSVIRRLVGYDRFVGERSHQLLKELYESARLFVNYFQPSVKLQSKQRDGGKVSRQYDRAQTPHERLMQSNVSQEVKQQLDREFDALDPVALLEEIESSQLKLWKTAEFADPALIASQSLARILSEVQSPDPEALVVKLEERRDYLQRRSTHQQLLSLPGTTRERILKRIHEFPKGQTFRPKHLLDLGTRTAVDQALTTLVRKKRLEQTGRGRYTLPASYPNVTAETGN